MLTLLQCPWSSHRVVHMSNWMNYRPNSILRFWSYRQMTHLTRNPPISIRLAEKSKFRKWNVHNVMHHNGSDDQNIAGKCSRDNYSLPIDFLKKLKVLRFLARMVIGRKSFFNPWPSPMSNRDHWFVSIHLKRGYLTCFKPTWHSTFAHLTFIFRECMITICSRCCKSGNIPQCSTITSHHQHFATNVSRFKSRMG